MLYAVEEMKNFFFKSFECLYRFFFFCVGVGKEEPGYLSIEILCDRLTKLW